MRHPMVRITVLFSRQHVKYLEALAVQGLVGNSRSEVVRGIVARYIENHTLELTEENASNISETT